MQNNCLMNRMKTRTEGYQINHRIDEPWKSIVTLNIIILKIEQETIKCNEIWSIVSKINVYIK